MSKYDFEITDAGIEAAANALERGYKVKITGVEIGDAVISVSQVRSMTRPAGNVTWKSEDNPEVETLFFQKVVDNGVQFKVELPNTIGNFLMGNICIRMEDGTIFAVACLPQQVQKIKKTNETTGNAYNFYLGTALDHAYEALDVSILPTETAQALPIADTENNLPEWDATWYNVWEVENYKNTNTSALALRGTTGWLFFTANNGSIVPEGDITFGPGVTEGKTVYYNHSQNRFDLGDGTNSNKGAIGIRNGDNVVYTGSYFFPAGTLTPGTKYYAGTDGSLTTTPNPYYMGVAISDTCLLLGIEWNPYASETTAGTVRFATTGEVKTATSTNTAVSPKTLHDNYPQTGKSETITAGWTFNGNNTFSGNNAFSGTTTLSAINVTGNAAFTAASTFNGSTTLNGSAAFNGNATFSEGKTYLAKGNWTFSNLIQGTCYRAKYADLAEYYECDKKYEPGTLLKFGGDKELTIADTEVNAVVSSNPAYTMGSAYLDSEFFKQIALAGRIPVRIKGKVKKHDRIYLSKDTPGVASTEVNGKCIGRALASSDMNKEKLVECSVLISLD